MNYAEKNLTKGEEIVLKAKISFWAVIPSLLWCIALLVVVIVFGPKLNDLIDGDGGKITIMLYAVWAVIGLLPMLIKIIDLFLCTHLCITNKRVIGKRGILRIKTLDYPINKVDNVSFKAGVIGNLFHYYNVQVLGGGSENNSLKFKGISNAQAFKNCVTEAVEKYADEARKAQAAEIAKAMSQAK